MVLVPDGQFFVGVAPGDGPDIVVLDEVPPTAARHGGAVLSGDDQVTTPVWLPPSRVSPAPSIRLAATRSRRAALADLI